MSSDNFETGSQGWISIWLSRILLRNLFKYIYDQYILFTVFMNPGSLPNCSLIALIPRVPVPAFNCHGYHI